LLALPVPASLDRVPLEDLLSMSRSISAKRISVKGRDEIQLSMEIDRTASNPHVKGTIWTLEVYLDPSVNFLVRNIVYRCDNSRGQYVRFDEVIKFKESLPGLYFPEVIKGTDELNGKSDFEYTLTVFDTVVNRTISKEQFQLRFIDGTSFLDRDRGVVYTIDSQGRRTTPEKPFRRPIPPPTASQISVDQSQSETETEPAGYARWVLLVSAMLTFFGVGVRALMKRRQSPNRI
jgi:hypothetical protein